MSPTKCEVQLFVAGQINKEVIIARDYDHAREIALARTPNTTVIGVTAIFYSRKGNELHTLNYPYSRNPKLIMKNILKYSCNQEYEISLVLICLIM